MKQSLPKTKDVASSETRYVRDTFLASRYDVSRNTIWRWVREGRLPKPERVGPGCTRFDLVAIERLDAQRSDAVEG